MSRILFFLSIAFIGGVFAHTLFLRSETASWEFEPYFAKEVLIQGIVSKDPQLREYSTDIVLKPDGAKGSILLQAGRFSSFQYGDTISAKGILELPPAFEDFNYREFLETKGIGAVMRNPEINLLRRGGYKNPFSLFYADILSAKQRFRSVLFWNFSPPEGTILEALLLGDQGRMSKELKDKLNKTGLRHVIAISGQHIVILTNMLMPFLLWLGLWKKQAIAASFAFMVFFVLLTGAEASAVRSGIMGGILLLSQYFGRMQISLRAIVFAAALMLLQNPLLLTRDVGFQLSFLATFGIITAFPLFRRILHKVPETFGLRDIIAMNFAAQLFTLPVLVYNFGYVSFVGILANILVLPIVPLLLGLGFLLLVAGSLWSVLGMLLSFPVVLLTKYLILVMELFAQVPFATIALRSGSLWLFIGFYMFLFFIIRKLKQEYEYL